MYDESDLAPMKQSGPMFWVPLVRDRGVSRLRMGILILVLFLLISFYTSFGAGHTPDAPAGALAAASLVVIVIRLWTLLIDLIYYLDSRERRYVMAYLIALGLTVALALVVRFTALLLDTLFSPTGHFFALQGSFAVLLTLLVAPITLSILHHEPPGFYWARLRLRDGNWSRAEQPLRRILSRHPQALRPALLLLECLLRQGKRDEAEELLKYLTRLDPKAWGNWAALGTLALEDEGWERAAGLLQEACHLAPRAVQGALRLNLGLALLGMGRLEEGRWEIEYALQRGLPPHLRQFSWFMLMRIGQVQQDPGTMLHASRTAKRHPAEGRAFLDWFETLDRSHAPTLAEDLYEALDWTRHLLGIRIVI
jgi:tetratricopeptide (TPR) repeat protein